MLEFFRNFDSPRTKHWACNILIRCDDFGFRLRSSLGWHSLCGRKAIEHRFFVVHFIFRACHRINSLPPKPLYVSAVMWCMSMGLVSFRMDKAFVVCGFVCLWNLVTVKSCSVHYVCDFFFLVQFAYFHHMNQAAHYGKYNDSLETVHFLRWIPDICYAFSLVRRQKNGIAPSITITTWMEKRATLAKMNGHVILKNPMECFSQTKECRYSSIEDIVWGWKSHIFPWKEHQIVSLSWINRLMSIMLIAFHTDYSHPKRQGKWDFCIFTPDVIHLIYLFNRIKWHLNISGGKYHRSAFCATDSKAEIYIEQKNHLVCCTKY